jgi:DNA-binding beta-propeller fold protein YncE
MTIAGTGVNGYNGENLNPKNSQINYPSGIAIDSLTSKIYFSDLNNNRIRVLY